MTTDAATPAYETIVYKTVDGYDLTLHVYRPDAAAYGDEPKAAIIFYFGGGWNGGSQGQFAPHSQHLANRGMISICADYRVNSRQGTTPDKCVEDGKDAWRYVHAHAAELGIDPDRLALGGGSAGGHVASASAVCDGFSAPDAPPVRASALCLFNPVIDCSAEDGYGHPRVQQWFPAISPRHSLRAENPPPPAIIFVGDSDPTTPHRGDEAFQAAAQALGSRCDLHIYRGQGHGFFNYRDGHNPYYTLTVAAMDHFLVSIGHLPPTQ